MGHREMLLMSLKVLKGPDHPFNDQPATHTQREAVGRNLAVCAGSMAINAQHGCVCRSMAISAHRGN